jgi:hypothetical protein
MAISSSAGTFCNGGFYFNAIASKNFSIRAVNSEADFALM